MCLRGCLLIVLILSAWSASGAQTGGTTPALHYDRPSGFSRGSGDGQTWIADSLDGVIHVYPFRPFHGDLAGEFRRTLFRDWISAPYREDKRLDQPTSDVAERERGRGGDCRLVQEFQRRSSA